MNLGAPESALHFFPLGLLLLLPVRQFPNWVFQQPDTTKGIYLGSHLLHYSGWACFLRQLKAAPQRCSGICHITAISEMDVLSDYVVTCRNR